MSNTSELLNKQQNDSSFDSLWDELKWRGLIHVSTDEEELAKLLDGEPIHYYCGFDPTAPSLHLGNLVQILVMRRLQLAGHTPIGLVGGSTGLIGDPRPTSERTLNDKKTVAEWVEYLGSQISKFLSFDGKNKAFLVNNLDWTQELSALDFLRDVGKYFRVGKMLSKDAVSARLNSEAGISYTEFSYQILQGMDFLELYRRHDCKLQTGGSDQWGNLTSGINLIAKAEGKKAHAIGTPLITNSDGTKFGKSEGNAIWLDEKMTSPYDMYQFWVNTADADVIDRLKVFTFLTKAEIEELEEAVAKEPYKRAAQKKLAFEVTSLVHGVKKTEQAIEAAGALFGRGDLTSLDEDTLLASLGQLEFNPISKDELNIINVLVTSGLVPSNSAARRTIKDGGAYVNNEKITDANAEFDDDQLLHNKYLVVRRGKKNLAALKVQN
ncbi:MAG: tyrosine--tRNA ligase [Micrococcaceae bacterium]